MSKRKPNHQATILPPDFDLPGSNVNNPRVSTKRHAGSAFAFSSVISITLNVICFFLRPLFKSLLTATVPSLIILAVALWWLRSQTQFLIGLEDNLDPNSIVTWAKSLFEPTVNP